MTNSQSKTQTISQPKRCRWWRKMLLVLLLILVAMGGFLLWACGGIQRPCRFNGEIREFNPPQPPAQANNTLTVMTWNIAWAYGAGSEGTGYEPRTRRQMIERIVAIGRVIRDSGADIVLLQEIDFDASRSARIDQLAELAQITGLPYGAYAPSWKANYVPFPYWPPSRQFGRVRSGGAILSRYPITDNQVQLHPKPKANSWVYNLFYLFRYTQRITVDVEGARLVVINNHLEAFDRQNRQDQAQWVSQYLENDQLTIFGGDMNALPPEAQTGRENDDYSHDSTIQTFRDIPFIRDVTSFGEYQGNYDAWRTFPADNPEIKLDYLFVSDGITIQSAHVVPAGDLSDHLPIVSVISWEP